MKRALKIFFKSLAALLLLIVLLAASLYLPPVQRWAVDRLTAWLEEETGLEVTVGSVHLAPLLDLSLGQVRIAKPPTDVIDVEHALLDLDLSRLLSLHVGVEAIELKGGSVRLTELIESLRMEGSLGSLRLEADDVDLRGKKAIVSEAMLDGCQLDICLRETPEDTTESQPLDWQIDIRQIKILKSMMHMIG